MLFDGFRLCETLLKPLAVNGLRGTEIRSEGEADEDRDDACSGRAKEEEGFWGELVSGVDAVAASCSNLERRDLNAGGGADSTLESSIMCDVWGVVRVANSAN